MRIILKYILKSIAEKKLRTFLIIASVAVSSALVFASAAISGTLVDMFGIRMKQYFGTSDFIVHLNGDTSGRSYSAESASEYKDMFEYIIGGFLGYAEYRDHDGRTHNVSLSGLDADDQMIISPVYIDRQSHPFEGKTIIAGNTVAERLGWKPGDSIELLVRGYRYKFTVGAVAQSSGMLFDDGESITVFVPKDTLSSLYGMRGRNNALYFKMKDPEQRRYIIDRMREVYKGCGFSWFSVTTDIDVPLKLLTVVVCFMSIFIIYSTFRVIALERLPAIGTFRSIGATKRTTGFILLTESTVYGVFGGITGCALGVGVLYVMAGSMKNSYTRNIDTVISFTPGQMLFAFGIAVVLCFVSSLIPIIKISGTPLKDIISNAIDRQYTRHIWKAACGAVMVIISVIIPEIVPDSLALPVDMACLIMIAISAVLLVPYITLFAVLVLERVYMVFFGNVGVLAVKNLKENKSILNSISLLSIGIATLLLVSNAAYSMNKDTINTYSCYDFDIRFYYYDADKVMAQRIAAVDGVDSVLGQYIKGNIFIQNFNENINRLDGVQSAKYFDFWKLDAGMEPEEIFRELDSGRKLMMANNLRHLLGVRKGDNVILQMDKGDRTYEVIGFYDTSLNSGNHAIVSDRFLKYDSGNARYSYIIIKSSDDPSVVAERIRSRFKREEPEVATVEELEQRSMEGSKQLTDILYGFAALTLLIGIIGVFNNLLISYIERKHTLSVLKSIGMSRKQTILMVFAEALTGGAVGGITGSVTGSLQLLLVPAIMRATGQYFNVYNNYGAIIIFVAAGMLITLVASISPAVKSSKLDIVSSLKYE
ncbi:MAG: ABC transporter permease [Clostridiaceae bacterium]|nr:ABC transporter permease [Clostridiaceae bacterium]